MVVGGGLMLDVQSAWFFPHPPIPCPPANGCRIQTALPPRSPAPAGAVIQFRANAGLNIPAYNGGLFAPDPSLDGLQVPDEVCAHFKDLGDYDYRPAREVAHAGEGTAVRSVIDVDILGHICEQSITDLERLRESLEQPRSVVGAVRPACQSCSGAVRPACQSCSGAVRPACLGRRSSSKRRGRRDALPHYVGRRRKQEGAVYTPAFITRYLVEQALGGVLKTRFDTLRRQHEAEAAGTARKTLADPNAYDLVALNDPQRKALIRFWEASQEELKGLGILDPACGSGAILIEAFNQLHAVYDLSNARLEELRSQRTLFDLDRQILQNNLYGVDLNEEAIQICQLSLWIKTAARGKQLTSLAIGEGNRVISDPAVHPKALDWQAAFPEVFAQGGVSNFPPMACPAGAGQYGSWKRASPWRIRCRTRFRSWRGASTLTCGIQERIQRLSSLRLEVCRRSSSVPSRRCRSSWLACHTRSRM